MIGCGALASHMIYREAMFVFCHLMPPCSMRTSKIPSTLGMEFLGMVNSWIDVRDPSSGENVERIMSLASLCMFAVRNSQQACFWRYLACGLHCGGTVGMKPQEIVVKLRILPGHLQRREKHRNAYNRSHPGENLISGNMLWTIVYRWAWYTCLPCTRLLVKIAYILNNSFSGNQNGATKLNWCNYMVFSWRCANWCDPSENNIVTSMPWVAEMESDLPTASARVFSVCSMRTQARVWVLGWDDWGPAGNSIPKPPGYQEYMLQSRESPRAFISITEPLWRHAMCVSSTPANYLKYNDPQILYLIWQPFQNTNSSID